MKPPSLRNLALIASGAALLSVFPYIPATRSANELVRLWQTRALVDFGTVELNPAMRAYGVVRDMSVMRDEHGYPHFYPSKAPLLSFAAAPVYAALKALHGGDAVSIGEPALVYFCRLFCTVLPALLVLWPLRRFLEAYFEPDVSAALLVASAVGSISFPYAELFMSHGLSGALLFLVFFALWKHRRGDWALGAFALAGGVAGVSVAAEYTAALALPALAAYGLATCKIPRGRAVAAAAVGLLPAVLFLAWYHNRCFGSPLETGYKHLADAGYQDWHVHGFLGITLPDLRALALSYFSPLRGMCVVSPFLLLALPGLVLLRKRSGAVAEGRVFLAILLCYTYFTSSFSYYSWGWTTGPRHLTPLVIFLLMPTGEALVWARRRSPWMAALAAALLALSIVNTGLLTQVNYISDCVRNGVVRLALPLVWSGHLPNSPLSILGVPNPWAWLPQLAALGLSAGVVTTAMVRGLPRWTGGAAMGIAFALFAAFAQIPSGPNTKCEDDTVQNMARDFMPQPGGTTLGFWSR